MVKELHNKLVEAVQIGLSKALDGDDMFDADDVMLDPTENDMVDSSVYVNRSKLYFPVKDFIDHRMSEYKKYGGLISVWSFTGWVANGFSNPNKWDAETIDLLTRVFMTNDESIKQMCKESGIYDVFIPRDNYEFCRIYQIFGNFSWLNVIDCTKADYLKISIVTINGKEVPLQFWNTDLNDSARLVKISKEPDSISETDICISKSVSRQVGKMRYFDIKAYVEDIHETIGGKTLHASVPNYNDICVVTKYGKLLDEVLSFIGGEKTGFDDNFWWTNETEGRASSWSVWYYNKNTDMMCLMPMGSYSKENRERQLWVLPKFDYGETR